MNFYTIVLIIKIIAIIFFNMCMLVNLELAIKKYKNKDIQGAIYELLWSLNMIALMILIK